jgi:hydrogenase maturation factor HypE
LHVGLSESSARTIRRAHVVQPVAAMTQITVHGGRMDAKQIDQSGKG